MRSGSSRVGYAEGQNMGAVLCRFDNPAALSNCNNLVWPHLSESLDLLGSRPLHFNRINDLCLSNPKMEPQVALRHHARATVHFISLRMSAGHHSHACADSGAIAFGSNQFDLDPILLIAAVVA